MFKLFKNLHIFHRWEKWSDVRTENGWVRYYHVTGIERSTLRAYQGRICSICGKYQRRYIY